MQFTRTTRAFYQLIVIDIWATPVLKFEGLENLIWN